MTTFRERADQIQSITDPDKAMAAVSQNGYALQYVREQTPELCMAAVSQNGYALRYVRDDMIAAMDAR